MRKLQTPRNVLECLGQWKSVTASCASGGVSRPASNACLIAWQISDEALD